MEYSKIRVALADDIEIVRRAMAAVLAQDSSIEVVGIGENGKELISICKEKKPDVAVVDIRMPSMGGIETSRWLKKHMPGVKILILTTFDDEDYIQELLSIGIDGYILKGGDDTALIGAVKSVFVGINTLTPAILEKLGTMIRHDEKAAETNPMALTPIELKVAELIGKNYFNKDIAAELNLTYGHVRNIVSRIYRKLGVNERDLVREFVDRDYD